MEESTRKRAFRNDLKPQWFEIAIDKLFKALSLHEQSLLSRIQYLDEYKNVPESVERSWNETQEETGTKMVAESLE